MVQVTKEMLTNYLNQGLSRKEIAAELCVPVSQLSVIIEMAGLKGHKAKRPMLIELVDSIAPQEVEEVVETTTMEEVYSIND